MSRGDAPPPSLEISKYYVSNGAFWCHLALDFVVGYNRKNYFFMWFTYFIDVQKKKWNESGFRPPLCTYRLNWARRTSWGWWDDRDDTVLQTQDSKFEPWRSEAEHATSRSRRLPTILTFTRGWGRNNFVSFKPPRPGTEPRNLAWKAAVLTTTLGPPPYWCPNATCFRRRHELRIKAGIAKKHVLLFFLHSARIGWLPISDINHDN